MEDALAHLRGVRRDISLQTLKGFHTSRDAWVKRRTLQSKIAYLAAEHGARQGGADGVGADDHPIVSQQAVRDP
jgi:hypothetical protein